MYFATGFAIVKIDPVKNEVRDTYYPTNGNAAILDLAFRNDSIFALTSTQMYHGDINNVALADPTEWTVDSRVPFLSANGYYEIENVLDEIYVLFKHDDFGMDTVYRLGETALELTHSESFPMEINSISSVNDQIAFHFGSTTIIYDENFNTILPLSDYGFATPNVEDMFYSDGIYWTADKQSGMVELTMSGARNINLSLIHI